MIDPSTAQTVYNDMGALADLRTRAKVREGPHVVVNRLRCARIDHVKDSNHNQLSAHGARLLESF